MPNENILRGIIIFHFNLLMNIFIFLYFLKYGYNLCILVNSVIKISVDHISVTRIIYIMKKSVNNNLYVLEKDYIFIFRVSFIIF